MTALIESSPGFLAGVLFCAGTIAGRIATGLAISFVDDKSFRQACCCSQCGRPFRLWQQFPLLGLVRRCGLCRNCGAGTQRLRGVTELTTGLLFAAYGYAMFTLECQVIDEVDPFELSRMMRLPYHLILISLLVTTTLTDLRDYVIPDRIVISGVLVGVVGATLSGDLQIIHVWVDWNQVVPGLHGPYIPDWISQHVHLHGLVWSVCGIVVAAGMTWLVRLISGRILGRPALGFGDVTLMAMIGSFLGWQPTVFVFALAPICGVAIAGFVRLSTGRGFLPYGPCLNAATVVVLMTWSRLWRPNRDIFGHWPSLATVAAVALAGFTLLLALLRVYRAIPVTTSGHTADSTTTDSVSKSAAASERPAE